MRDPWFKKIKKRSTISIRTRCNCECWLGSSLKKAFVEWSNWENRNMKYILNNIHYFSYVWLEDCSYTGECLFFICSFLATSSMYIIHSGHTHLSTPILFSSSASPLPPTPLCPSGLFDLFLFSFVTHWFSVGLPVRATSKPWATPCDSISEDNGMSLFLNLQAKLFKNKVLWCLLLKHLNGATEAEGSWLTPVTLVLRRQGQDFKVMFCSKPARTTWNSFSEQKEMNKYRLSSMLMFSNISRNFWGGWTFPSKMMSQCGGWWTWKNTSELLSGHALTLTSFNIFCYKVFTVKKVEEKKSYCFLFPFLQFE